MGASAVLLWPYKPDNVKVEKSSIDHLWSQEEDCYGSILMAVV